MEVLYFDDAEEYRALVDPLLLSSEAENCLLLGVTGTLISRPEIYEEFHLWVVTDEGTPIGAAAMTPPHNLLLAQTPSEEWLSPLADFITSQGVHLPGVQGNTPNIEYFCATWQGAHPVSPELEVELGVHVATKVSSVPSVPGEARSANDGDFDLVIAWTSSFLEEADPLVDRSQLELAVNTRLGADPAISGIWLWEIGDEPVSLSGYGDRKSVV